MPSRTLTGGMLMISKASPSPTSRRADDQASEYTVRQLELDFWDKLARVTAYAAFQTISEVP